MNRVLKQMKERMLSGAEAGMAILMLQDGKTWDEIDCALLDMGCEGVKDLYRSELLRFANLRDDIAKYFPSQGESLRREAANIRKVAKQAFPFKER